MKAKAILLASVLLVGCQSTGNVQQHAQSLSAAGQGEAAKFTSQARWIDDGTSIAPDGDLWAFIGDELKMGIPENDRIREQKQKYLPDLLSGKKLGAFGLTEPNAGTDASGQQTRAELVGDKWILNGAKVFITNGGYADVFVVMAMTDKKKGNHGISAFIVEKGDPGFSIGKTEDKMGICASSTTELIFQNCEIPADRLLGQVGDGFKVAMSTLDGGRIGIASQALGIAQGAFDVTVDYMNARKQFGKKLSQFQALQFEMADLKTRIEAARLLVYRAADMKDKHLPYGEAAAMAKLYAAETAMAVTTKCVQYHGGYGYTKDYPVERMMRDAKITEIYEGTSEVQRMVIAGKTFKK